MNAIKRDLTAGIFFLVVGLFITFYTFTLPKMNIGEGVYVHIVPLVIGIAIIVCSAYLLINVMRRRKLEYTEVGMVEEAGEKPSVIPFVGTLILLFIYAALIETVGFIIMTFLYLIAQINVLALSEKKNQYIVVAVSAVSTIVIYLIFDKVLTLFLPSGLLG